MSEWISIEDELPEKTEVKKYRKKPLVVEALQLRWDTWQQMCDFIGLPHDGCRKIKGTIGKENAIGLDIHTLEGTLKAQENDYIIKGIKGEFYPCREDIFDETYIEAEDE